MNHSEQLLQTHQMAKSTNSDSTNSWWELLVNVQGELVYIAGADCMCIIILENSLALFFRIKHKAYL